MAIDDADGHAQLLTSEQVTDRLAHEPSLRRVALNCVLRAIRIGGVFRFQRGELDDWIALQLREPSKAPPAAREER